MTFKRVKKEISTIKLLLIGLVIFLAVAAIILGDEPIKWFEQKMSYTSTVKAEVVNNIDKLTLNLNDKMKAQQKTEMTVARILTALEKARELNRYATEELNSAVDSINLYQGITQ